MQTNLPAWALRRVTAADFGAAREAQRRARLQVKWPPLKALRAWANQRAWPAPRFGFEAAFLTHLLDSEANFEFGLGAAGLELTMPVPAYTLTPEELAELDALYAARSDSGRPTSWGALVQALREIRRAVEAGVEVTVDGAPPLRTWQGFYAWAHGRYHMLEDGYDSWIGDDAT